MRIGKRYGRLLWSLLALALFALALWALHGELEEYRYHDIVASLRRLSAWQLWAALLLTVLNYAVLTGYDALALAFIGRRLHYARTALASFIGYAFSNNVGLSAIAGTGVRLRLYSAWGLSALEIAKVVAFYSVTFWIGLLAVGGTAFVLEPTAFPGQLHVPFATTLPLGAVLLLALAGYLLATAFWKKPLVIRGEEIALPPLKTACIQTAISSLDWVLAGAVLFALLPEAGRPGFFTFLGVFLLGQFAGIVSHVPGGLGVFEGVLVALLSGQMPAASIFAALIAYRAIYYLLPLTLAAVLLGAHEALERRESLKRVASFFGSWVPELAPRVIALMTFVGGTVLLFSGATPEIVHRVAVLKGIIPLPVLEISHFLGSLTGALLLILARGLQRRLDAAYVFTALLLTGGIALSLLKGLDYEEAVFLGLLLAALLPCRKYFYRRSSLLSPAFTPGWIAAILLVLLCAAWLGVFSYKHVEYSHDLWWSFAFHGDASRFLRAIVGSVAVVFLFAAARLMRPAPPGPAAPTPEELAKAREIAEASPNTAASVALLGDKAFLFSESGRSFLMYGVEGRSWVALGDPVGPPEERAELIWRFREEVDLYGGWTVFYEVGKENLPLYLDLGLTLLKVGEEAKVPLASFSLDGAGRKSMRNLRNKLEKDGWVFEILPPESVPALIPALREISDDWLAEKKTREKGFSLGFFDPDYLSLFPCVVVRKAEDIVAFANLLTVAGKQELSVDLMRFSSRAPSGIMDFLFIRLLLWGKENGYGRFDLGMAPLSGLESKALAPLWSKIGSLLFRTGERYYNFQGIRQYKEKFAPSWEPKYLACPGGISLAPVLANIASLVGRGVKGVVSR